MDIALTQTPADRARLAVLAAVRRSDELWGRYALKGGLALRLAYGSPRRSDDLDLTAVKPFAADVAEAQEVALLRFGYRLNEALAETALDWGCAQVRVQRRRLSDELPALLCEVGYTTDPAATPPFEGTVPMQVTLSEVVCETAQAEAAGIPLYVATLEDILAEKLKALAQQVYREGASRASDVFDLWYFSAWSEHALDVHRIVECLREKAAKWDVIQPVTRARYRDPAVRASATEGYEGLRDKVDDSSIPFPPFDDAFSAALALVDRLPLPEG